MTANEVHMPVGVPLKLELESADVIHSFWVPQLGWKKMPLPERPTICGCSLIGRVCMTGPVRSIAVSNMLGCASAWWP